MYKFLGFLILGIQLVLIGLKGLGILAVSWWAIMTPILLIIGLIALCLIIILLFAWAVGDVTDRQEDY